jgi:D-lactate dehydrogenase
VTERARKLTHRHVPRVYKDLKPGPGAPKKSEAASAPLGEVVYFPSCATRMFGVPKTDYDLLPATEAMIVLLQRVGFAPVVPENVNGQCCGQPFESKGFPEESRRVGDRLMENLGKASRGGAAPVITDASTCAKHLRTHHADQPVADSAEFLHREILPRLTITRKLPVVAVHHNCSAQRLKEQSLTEAIVAASAEKAAVINSVTCCGYAGDKGLFIPELNAHATRFMKNDIPEGCNLGVSTVATCASGLSQHAGIPFVSLASLLEYASRP